MSARANPSFGFRALQTVYVAFAFALVMIFAMALKLPKSEASGTVPIVLLAVYTVGVLGFAAVVWSRPLSLDSELALAGSYRSRFFVRIALADAPFLMGFVVYLITGILWPYIVTLVVTALMVGLAAPTSAALARDQREIVARGSILSLKEALERQPGS